MIDLEKQTVRINLALAGTCVAAIVSATLWINNQITGLHAAIDNLQSSIDVKTADRFTKTDAAEVALRNAILNPGMRFSDPRTPGQFIVVDSGRITTKGP